MPVVINGTTGITNDAAYNGDGVTFADNTPANTLVTTSGGNVGVGTSSPLSKLAVSNAGAATLELFTNYPGGGVGTYIQSYNRSGAAYVSTAYDAADHSFRISGTERARLDTAGRFTVPNQPAFHVTHSNGTSTTGTIVWTNVVFNTGNNYNTSNGRFTAPVAGVYYFCFHTLIQNAPGGEARTAIYKNGAGYGGLRFITIKPANSWWSLIAYGTVYLSTNEYVTAEIEQTPGALYSDANYNHFSGYLVA